MESSFALDSHGNETSAHSSSFIQMPFTLDSYEAVAPYFADLLKRDIQTYEDARQRLVDLDELEKNIDEIATRIYVNNSCYNQNEEYKKKYMDFISEIEPRLAMVGNEVNQKILALPHIEKIVQEDEGYAIVYKKVKKDKEMYREENVPLFTEIQELSRQYGEITGAMMIDYNGETLTLSQASKYLQSSDRAQRKEIYEKIAARRVESSDALDALFSKQVELRDRIAKNAGYDSFVEYQWDAYHRFDYSQTDVFAFHEGVKEYFVPLATKLMQEKKEELNIVEGGNLIKPYDVDGIPEGQRPLQPVQSTEELLEKFLQGMQKINPVFHEYFAFMQQQGGFDLASRQGKNPGGYCTDFPMAKHSFIFMNAKGTHYDVTTLFHEGGHSLHNYYKQLLPFCMRSTPLEIAEVASTAMEYFSMDLLDMYYENEEDRKRVQKEKLIDEIVIKCWIAIIDSFQYWIYKHPTHTVQERDEKRRSLLAEYQPWLDYSDYEDFAKKRRQAQLHIFEVPFYYIEYGIAELGAIGVRRNYVANRSEGLKNYIAGLSLGYAKKLPTLFETMGVPFDFSPEKLQEVARFLEKQYDMVK